MCHSAASLAPTRAAGEAVEAKLHQDEDEEEYEEEYESPEYECDDRGELQRAAVGREAVGDPVGDRAG